METDAKNLIPPSSKRLSILFQKAIKKTDSVLFTGPEPTVNKSLVNYIKMAKKIGYKDIRLVTNGRLLCHFDYARELLKSGLTEFNIALHGSKRSIHDAMTRTPHSFDQTIKGCYNLSKLKSDYLFRWYISFTLTKVNSPDLYNFLKLTVFLKGVNGSIINTVIPQGGGLIFFKNLISNYTDLADSFKSAIERLKKNPKVQSKDRFNISILGLPVCLLVGYEKYASEYESILMNSGNKKINIRKRERSKKLKREKCKECKYDSFCEGVWWRYIKMKGWREFHPIK